MIGGQSLIDKYWLKFEGLDIKCLCKDKHCVDNAGCSEYIVKLMEVERPTLVEAIDNLNSTTKELVTTIKKEGDELKKSIKKLKRFKL